jgi:hypothetical protein
VTYNAHIVPIIMNYWISFVRDLSPNSHKYQEAPHWEAPHWEAPHWEAPHWEAPHWEAPHWEAPHWEAYTHEKRRMLWQANATAYVLEDQLAGCESWIALTVTLEF